MSDWLMNDIREFTADSIEENSVMLWILHADKVPPHVGISIGHAYFSLKVDGKDVDVNVKNVLSVIRMKSIPTLLANVQDSPIRKETIREIYNQFEYAEAPLYSCLTPIKQLFQRPEVTKLISLLEQLEADACIRGYYGLNLPQDYRGIPFYTEKDIHNHLNQLTRDMVE